MRPQLEAATILYVGDDICQRIPVMERRGFRVIRTQESPQAIGRLLATAPGFAAITFHSDVDPLPEDIVRVARSLSLAPLVLFENPCSCAAQNGFDLVIPVLTSPNIWLDKLAQVIEASRNMRTSRQSN